MENILIGRHLDDIDDLEEHGRDAPIIDSPENLQKIDDISNAIYKKVVEENKKAILFVTSPRLRARQTAELAAKDIQEKGGTDIKMRFSVNEDIHSTEQGDFILPENYVAGETFPGLKIAGKIFDRETHGSDYPGGVDNIDYRFGDPIKLSETEFKYPELAPYFKNYGETYRETLIRTYSTVLDTSKKYESFQNNTEVVVIGHGQNYHLFRGLLEISKLIKNHSIEYKTGDSIKLLWEIYKNCSEEQKVPGICLPLDFTILSDQDMMSILEEELNFLKNPITDK